MNKRHSSNRGGFNNIRIREDLLITNKRKVKMRFLRGGTVEDTTDNIKSILKRGPDFIISHVGTNNAVSMTSRDILNKLMQLKPFIMKSNKNYKVIISQPTLRSDNEKGH